MKIYRSYPVFFIAEFIKTYGIKHFFTKYQLLKFILITFILGFLTSIIIVGEDLNLFNFSETFFYYVTSFWKANLLLLVIVFMVFILLYSNAFRGQFKLSIQYNTKPFKLDPHVEVVFKNINRIFLIITFLYALIFAIPIIQLTNTKFITLFTPVFGVMLSVFIRLLMKKKEKDTNKDFLNEMHFQRISYNSASIGNVSSEVEEELDFFNKIYKPNPFNNNIIEYFNGALSSNFKGFKAIFEELIKIINPELNNELHSQIVIRERTTDAVTKIIEVISDKTKKVFAITTNAEYPEILNTVKELIINNHIIDFEKELILGTYTEQGLTENIITKIKENITTNDYIIILLSHIYYKTGTVVSIEEILKSINNSVTKSELKKVIFICDGAQAVGNILISESIIANSHFYVFGGHKWLMSLPSIGFAINNKKLIKNCNLDYNRFMFTNRSFSSFEYSTRDYKGTIDPYPYISLYMSLVDLNKTGIKIIEAHNKYLSDFFRDSIKTNLTKAKPLNLRHSGGLATIHADNSVQLNDFLLNRHDNASGFLVDEERNLIRFSFHYNMGIKHINRLVFAMMEFEKSTAHNIV